MPVALATSPRVAALAADLASGRAEALESFWRQVAAEGTPLIERAEDHPGQRVVTFLWRARDAGTRGVLLLINRLTDYRDLPASALTRLPGSDVWHKSFRLRADWRGTYQIAPDDDRAPVAPGSAEGDGDYWRRLLANAIPDPLNRQTMSSVRGRLARSKPGGTPTSVAELPEAPAQPWWRRREDVAAGDLGEHELPSAVLGNRRRVWVYTPPGHAAAAGPYDVLVLLDGEVWGPLLPIQHTLDNLIAAGLLRPVVALLPDSIDGETRHRELACHEPFVSFLTEELLPWASERWRITADPGRTTIAGQSLGALSAAYAGLLAPQRFGNVVAQSASLWWKAGSEFDVEAEWLTRRFALTPRRVLRFYLEVGLQEWVLLPLTRHLRDVLDARGYDLTYAEFNGGHDFLCWRGGLADGLLALAGHRC